MVISIENADHYIWGDVCDGWRLLQRDTCTGASAGVI